MLAHALSAIDTAPTNPMMTLFMALSLFFFEVVLAPVSSGYERVDRYGTHPGGTDEERVDIDAGKLIAVGGGEARQIAECVGAGFEVYGGAGRGRPHRSPVLRPAAGGADESVPSANPRQIRHARVVIGKPLQKLGKCPRVVHASDGVASRNAGHS